MARKRVKGIKYSRVTKQQKYVFLKLCISQKQSIHQAAYQAGIHYSTAKTILYFHKRQYKNYETYIINDAQIDDIENSQPRALYKEIINDQSSSQNSLPRIEVISKCYTKKSSQKGLWKQRRTLSDNLSLEKGSQYMKMEDESMENKECYQEIDEKVKPEETKMKPKQQESKWKNYTKFWSQQYKIVDEKQ